MHRYGLAHPPIKEIASADEIDKQLIPLETTGLEKLPTQVAPFIEGWNLLHPEVQCANDPMINSASKPQLPDVLSPTKLSIQFSSSEPKAPSISAAKSPEGEGDTLLQTAGAEVSPAPAHRQITAKGKPSINKSELKVFVHKEGQYFLFANRRWSDFHTMPMIPPYTNQSLRAALKDP